MLLMLPALQYLTTMRLSNDETGSIQAMYVGIYTDS
jgi:hypothetical protein